MHVEQARDGHGWPAPSHSLPQSFVAAEPARCVVWLARRCQAMKLAWIGEVLICWQLPRRFELHIGCQTYKSENTVATRFW
jgi:hypothetical protein